MIVALELSSSPFVGPVVGPGSVPPRGVLGFLNENPFIIDHGNCLRGPGDLNFGCGVVHGPILD